MKTSVERVDDTTVKLLITVEAPRVSQAVDAAAQELAATVKVPGFRPGRVPRRVLESRLGKGTLLQEAVRDALPTFYSEAVQAEELPVVGPPSFDVDTFEEGSDAVFSATVEVRPDIDVPDYAGMQVPHPEWELTDAELDEQLDQMRERFASLETVDRPADEGDYLVITITGTRNGQKVDEASGEDLLYEVPTATEEPGADESGAARPDRTPLDHAVLGAKAGDVVTFTDELGQDYEESLAGQTLDFTALVKEVKRKQLPALDDDFALTASEFDTIGELRDDLRQQMSRQKRAYARAALRGRVVEAVAEKVEVPLPKALVDEELRFRINRLGHQAQEHGMTLEAYLAAAGTGADTLVAQLTDEARKTVKAQLVVDAIGRAAHVDISQEDLGVEIARQAARLGRPAEELAEFMLHPDRLGALVSDAYRRKTIDHLVEQVDVLAAPPEEPEDDEAVMVEADEASAVEGAIADAEAEAAAAADAEDDEPEAG